jgi:hypothetical protein
MPTYYKYCNQLGALKILGNLQLKLPYISDVNDPLECRPRFIVNSDFDSAKQFYLSLLQQRGESPGADFDNRFRLILNDKEGQKMFKAKAQNTQDEWNKRACLLSVSYSAKKTVMWAHYGNGHKGAVIGIDFDQFNIYPSLVNYSSERPPYTLFKSMTDKEWKDCVLTKLDSWRYEIEYREVFVEKSLRELEVKGLACNKDFEGKHNWFLILRPDMIKEVAFGLCADVDFKATIRRVVDEHIPDVKFFQTRISEDAYDLELALVD